MLPVTRIGTPAKVVFTKHGQERMRQRGILRALVTRALLNPADKERLPDEENKWAFRIPHKGVVLEVVAYRLPKEEKFILKTAYFV